MKKQNILLSSLLGLALSNPFAVWADHQHGVEAIKSGADSEHCDNHKKDGKAADKKDCDKHEKCDEHCKHQKQGAKDKEGMKDKHGYHMPSPEMMLSAPRLQHLKAMSLADEQDKQVTQLADTLKQENEKRLQEIKQAGSELRNLYAAEKLDSAAIGAVYDKIFNLQKQMIVAVIEAENKGIALLTPEQLQHFKKHREMMSSKRAK